MKNKIVKRKIVVVFIWLIVSMNYIYSQNCSAGYTFYGNSLNELPETATIIQGDFGMFDSCLSNIDLTALSNIIYYNNLNYENSINIGNQTWKDGRLMGLVANYSPNGSNGVNEQLTVLPESFGDLDELTFLYLAWNSLTSLPNSFSQLISLVSLTINNNWLTSLPEDFGNINELYFLDLGYNQLHSIPESICQLEDLQYLYLFNNELETLPECICDLNIDWSDFDGGQLPYFGIGANLLCNDVPECIENSDNFELTLDQFYYSIPLDAPQDCCVNLGDMNGDGGWNVLDVVTLANCVLTGSCEELPTSQCGDLNLDGGWNVLDIVTLANCVLTGTCG